MVQKISQIQTDIQSHNSTPADQERKIDVNALMAELEQAINDLVRMKLTIFIASTPMRENILRLAEAKSRISFLKEIDTHEGRGKQNDYGVSRRSGYIDSEVDFAVQFDILWVRTEIAKCEEEIDKLQEELDVFNHNTEIEF